jgi:hexokinase
MSMSEELKAALIYAAVAASRTRVEAMRTKNGERVSEGLANAYGEEAFHEEAAYLENVVEEIVRNSAR